MLITLKPKKKITKQYHVFVPLQSTINHAWHRIPQIQFLLCQIIFKGCFPPYFISMVMKYIYSREENI